MYRTMKGGVYLLSVMCVLRCVQVGKSEELTFVHSVENVAYWNNPDTLKHSKERYTEIMENDFFKDLHFQNVLERNAGFRKDDSADIQKIKQAISYNVSDQCWFDMEILLSSLSRFELYALQMVDAAGKPGTNFLQGHMTWPGSYSECQSTKPSVYVNRTYSVKPFNTRYCSVTMAGFLGPNKVTFNQGFCMPDSCSADDVKDLVSAVLSVVLKSYVVTGSQCQIYWEDRKLDKSAICVIGLLSVIGAIIVVGSLYDLYKSNRSPVPDIKTTEPAISVQNSEDIEGKDTIHPDYRYNPLLNNTISIEASTPSVISRVLVGFSVFTNGSKVLTVGPSSESNLSSIHGIRFLSMSWVILGHTYAFISPFMQNPLILLTMAKRFTGQAIVNATVSVDSFFVLSGVLVAYLLLREIEAKGGVLKVSWWKFYFHRFWRLTPAYMLVLGSHVTLLYYIGEGPFWPDNFDKSCRTDWWQNILYINNFFTMNNQCFGWAWYLANDMQFFLITPLLVIPLAYPRLVWQIIGFAINGLFLLANIITVGVLTYRHGYPADVPSLIGDPTLGQRTPDYNDVIYQKPWCRIGPYIIGVLVGYLLYKTRRSFHVHKAFIFLGWMVAATMNIAVLYGLYNVTNGHKLSPGVNAFYAAVHRNVWALGLGWVIFACCTGNGGPVDRLLSWSGFVPLSRLTYMAYLIHPIIIYYYFFSLQSPLAMTDISMIYLFLGNMVVTYVLSFVFSLAFEAPLITLEKVLLPR